MKLFHISPVPNITTLIPKRPKNGFIDDGFEDGKVLRISLAPTIMGCVRGVDYGYQEKIMYVYQPTSVNPKYLIQPTPRQVPDVRWTHEVWYTKPLNVKLIGAIKLKGVNGFTWVSNGKGNKSRFQMRVYKYKYNKIKTPTIEVNPSRKEKIKNYLWNRIANYYSNKQ